MDVLNLGLSQDHVVIDLESIQTLRVEDLNEKPLTVNMMLVGIAVFPEDELDSLMPLPSEEEDDGSGAGAYGY